MDLEGGLGGDQFGFSRAERPQREGPDPHRHQHRRQHAGASQDDYRQQDPPAADAESRKGDEFAVGRHPAKPKQDADQDSHGDCESEYAGKGGKKQLQDLAARARVAYEQLHQSYELRDEEHEREDDEAEERMAGDFADDVTVQDAHGQSGPV